MNAPTGPSDDHAAQPWDAAPTWDGSDPWLGVSQPPGPVPGSTRPAVRRRPVLMGLAGLIGGLGVAFLLVHFAKIALGTKAPIIVILIGAVVGVALSYTLPPRRPRRPK